MSLTYGLYDEPVTGQNHTIPNAGLSTSVSANMSDFELPYTQLSNEAYRGLFSGFGTLPQKVQAEDNSNALRSQINEFAMQNYLVDKSNSFNAQEAQIQRDWDEKMRASLYQTAVEDMKKAGINPVLALGHGISSGGLSSSQATSSGVGSVSHGQFASNKQGVQTMSTLLSLVGLVAGNVAGGVATAYAKEGARMWAAKKEKPLHFGF
ncbi:MAG: hypothetical protein J6C93_03290 [Clostridia bacterium]|nr:hypothetical protein [Clostridia bacterium]